MIAFYLTEIRILFGPSRQQGVDSTSKLNIFATNLRINICNRVAIYNKDEVWYLRDGFTNGASVSLWNEFQQWSRPLTIVSVDKKVQLKHSEGHGSELWNFQPE